MASSKTTGKTERLQVVLKSEDFKEVATLAEESERSHSATGAILIREALAARKASSNHSKDTANR